MDNQDSLPTYDEADGPPPSFSNDADNGELPTFVLDGQQVFRTSSRDLAVYLLDHAFASDKDETFVVSKVKEDAPTYDGGSLAVPTSDPIYEFKMSVSNGKVGRNIDLKGKGGEKFTSYTYDETSMAPSIAGWGSVNVYDHFQTEIVTKGKRHLGAEIAWKDTSGRELAVETPAPFDKKLRKTEPPRLMLTKELNSKDLDLLVACWLARSWKMAQKYFAGETPSGKFSRMFNRNKYDDPNRYRLDTAAAENMGAGQGMGAAFGVSLGGGM